MRVSIKTLALAAAGAASLGLVAAMPNSASACDITSVTDIACGTMSINPANPLSPLNPSNQSVNNPAPYGYGTGGAMAAGGILPGLFGDEPAAEPVPDVAPQTMPAVRHRHHRHRVE